MLPFTMPELSEAVRDVRVTARRHPHLPLTIYNYAPEVQYSNKWDSVTRACRGLILDDEGCIVARPWEKFFNLGQVNLPIQFDTPVEVMDKVDGSLGILYPEPPVQKWNGGNPIEVQHYAIATRGSFESEQAKHATEVWDEKYSHIDMTGMEDFTFLFEIVYRDNRIVLDYGDQDDLVLLGMVQKSTGYYFGPREAAASVGWDGPVVEVMPFNTLSNALAKMDRKNAEGYVVRSHNFMVKLKQPDYIDLHRLVTNASPKTVWEKLKSGMSKSEIVSAFPDEFHTYIESMIDPLLEVFDRRLMTIIEGYEVACSRVGPYKERKDYAAEFKRHKDVKYYFLLLDNRSVQEVLWSELKPAGKGEGAWSESGEDNNPFKE
jgi:RNA ligase